MTRLTWSILLLLGVAPGLGAQTKPLDWSGPPGSGKPFLTSTANGELLLTWFEPRPEQRYALRVATRSALHWSEPRTVAEGNRFFVNWADFPSIVETARGTWVVHWLERTAEKSYAYHIRIATSKDRGRSWSPSIIPHSDRTPTEHGFVAMLPATDGSVAVSWLDGRQMMDSSGSMALRTVTLRSDGTLYKELTLDPRTCECCQVAMARTTTGLIAAYRDRGTDEVRDIAVVRELGGRWTGPSLVGRDNWVVRACPVNGPSIAAIASDVAVAWFTAADGAPRVKVAFSNSNGERFGPSVVADDGRPLGRVHLQMTGPTAAVLVWLEAKDDQAEWRLRRITPAGVGTAVTLGETSRTREAGFPRTTLVGNDLFVAWTDPGSGPATSQVRVRKIPLIEIK